VAFFLAFLRDTFFFRTPIIFPSTACMRAAAF
jgi:hypothetical protein